MLPHLLELRHRSLQVLGFFFFSFLLFFFLAPDLFHLLMGPLLHTLPAKGSMIATQITAPVMIPMKLAMDLAVLCTAPFALLHLWRFISPALFQNERRLLQYAIVASLGLFCLGLAFCFYIVLPNLFYFFVHSLPQDIRLMPDMASSADFITRTLLAFGIYFQIPLICMLAIYFKWVELTTLKTIRPYVIVAAFTLSMLLTPPDVLSQILLAVPLCLLYELGIILSKLFVKRKTLLSSV